MCPLLIATARGDLHVVEMCTQSPQVDLNIANNEGKTALILAIENGNTDVLDALLCEDVERMSINIDHRDVSLNKFYIAQYLVGSIVLKGNGSNSCSCGCGEWQSRNCQVLN